jgi:two-component system response regulator YesN
VFKEKFGTSLVEYVNRRRVEGAVKLLREGELSVDEIIARTGYTDRSAFYHAFSKITGMAPAEYRTSQKVK